MADKDLPSFDEPTARDDEVQLPSEVHTGTETIDFDEFPDLEELATTSSFDLRKVKQAAYGRLLQAIPIPVLFVDRSGSIVFVNEAVGKITEKYAEIEKTSFADLFPDARESRRVKGILDTVLSDRKPRVFETLLQIANRRIWGRTHLRSIRVHEQQLVLVLVEDLTPERKRLILNEKYRKLVNLLPIGIVEFALTRPVSTEMPEEEVVARILDAKAVDGNEEFARIHGFDRISDVMGAGLGQLFPFSRSNRALYRSWIRAGFPISSAESKENTPDGMVRYLESTLIGIVRKKRLAGFWLAKRDITARQSLSEDTLRAQKLESIGILAGGIAHDFNNILTAILGNINLAKLNVHGDRKTGERLDEAEKGVARAKELTAQLLTFSRGGVPIKKVCSISSLLEESVPFALRGSNVRIDLSIPEDVRPVEVDEGQINQVINNIVINADQAMPDGGTLEVTADNVLVTPDMGLPLADGEYVKVSVKDRGIGISEEHLPRVFDPYFTTKQKGSGLGLASCYSIVKRHDGFMTVESELSAGTTFHLYLPVSTKDPRSENARDALLVGGGGRVLVMDDEQVVRDVACEMLKELGYDADSAPNGEEAVELYQKALSDSNPYVAVIMDLTVPGAMGGKEAVKELLRIDPLTRAIVSSGYSNDPVMGNFEDYGFKGVVTKPYDTAELNLVLRKVTGIPRTGS